MTDEILVIEDDVSLCTYLAEGLGKQGFKVTWHTNPADALPAFKETAFRAVVTDLRLRGADGLELCQQIVAHHPAVPVLVMTAFGSMDAAIRAIRAGAYDFLAKPFELEALVLALRRAIGHRALKEEVSALRQKLEAERPFREILGESPPVRELCTLLRRVAQSDASVLIMGETGTGKELAARAIHQHGPRSSCPFVAINCAAMPEALLESELFGHERGAFTDAKSARGGLIRQAQGGTLFLDEIGDMPLQLQAKFLRALQEQRIRPVGSDRELAIDVGIVSATHHDLEAAVREGRFREDFLYRINVVQVDVPPLRLRGNDVLILAQHFLQQFARRSNRGVTCLSSPFAKKLLAYDWPGNIRELANCIERAVALADHDTLVLDDLPEKIRGHEGPSRLVLASDDPTDLLTLAQVERRYILHVLDVVGGNKARAARVLGMDRTTLYRKLDRHGGG